MANMGLTDEEIAHVAHLARLGLDARGRQRMGTELRHILEHIEKLQKVDTSAVPETAQVGTLVNVWREDEAQPSISAETALGNAPDIEEMQFVVGAIQE